MTDFAALFPDDIMMQTLGDDVTYIAAGSTAVSIKAFVNYGTQPIFAGDAFMPERQVTITALKADAINCGKAAKFIHNGLTLTVDSMLNDDGIYAAWTVRK